MRFDIEKMDKSLFNTTEKLLYEILKEIKTLNNCECKKEKKVDTKQKPKKK